MTPSDTYKTISRPSTEVLFKDRNSKFFGYAFPVKSEANVKQQRLYADSEPVIVERIGPLSESMATSTPRYPRPVLL